MSAILFIRGVIIPIFYTGVGFLGATLYNSYKTEENIKELGEIKIEEIKIEEIKNEEINNDNI